MGRKLKITDFICCMNNCLSLQIISSEGNILTGSINTMNS